MKTKKMLPMLMGMLLVGAGVTAQSESLTVPLSEPGKPYKLEVGLVNGGITLIGYEGKDIVVEAQSGSDRKKKDRTSGGNSVEVNVNTNVNISGGRDRESGSGMRKLSAANNGLDVSAQERNNRVTINTDSWKRAVDLVIKVPASGGTFRINATNNGDIVISNINGEMEVSNTNGSISFNNVSGTAIANTVNGNLTGVFKSVDGKSPMAFSTLNGRVDITFPALVKANIKAKSDRGEVYSDFDVDVDKAPAKVNRSSEKGMYKLNIEDWILGRINGGGPEMMLKTMNGNIYIRKAK
ncbi:DUF4097 domain-containing protein [Sediminibacterium soli]|uniref:DUF4097 domain-containing protein n=1 Tax=Sediminibacterium soli TaxID=2698829 RepID=UPI0013797C4F|nr:DUF4097 domain-containing protein [Sediminibacterium soli]NCI45651.1 DUF4097 domain-containing protein [Sediminibacterium soli]